MGWHIVNHDEPDAQDEPYKSYEDFNSWCDTLSTLVSNKNIKEYQRFKSSLRSLELVTPLGKAAHHFILLVAEDEDVTYISLEKDQKGIFAGVSTDCKKLITNCNKQDKRAGYVYPMDSSFVYLGEPYYTLKRFLQSIVTLNDDYSIVNDNCQHLVDAIFSVLKQESRTFDLPPRRMGYYCKNQMVCKKYAEKFLNGYRKEYGQNVLNNKLYSPMEQAQIFGPAGSGKTEMALHIVANIKDRDAIYVNVSLPLIMNNKAKRDFDGSVRNFVSSRILDVLYTPLQSRPLINPYKELKELLRRRNKQLFIALDGVDNIIKNHPVYFRKMIEKLGSNYVHILIVASERLWPTHTLSMYECKGISESVCKSTIEKALEGEKKGEIKSFEKMICEFPINTENNADIHDKNMKKYFSPEVFNHRLADYQKKKRENELKGAKYNTYPTVTPEGIIETKYGDLIETEKVCLLIIAVICLGQEIFTVEDVKDFIGSMIASKLNQKIGEVLLEEHPDLKQTLPLICNLLRRILDKLAEMSIIQEVDKETYVIRSSICQFLLEYGKEEYISELRSNFVYHSLTALSKSPEKDWIKNMNKLTYIKRKCEAERAISMVIGNSKNLKIVVDKLKLSDVEFLRILRIIENYDDVDNVQILLNNLSTLLWYPSYCLIHLFKNHINNLLKKEFTIYEGFDGCIDAPKQTVSEFYEEYPRYNHVNELIWKVIHPRLLYILHNKGKDESYIGLPRDPSDLSDVFRKESIRKLIKEFRLTQQDKKKLFKECNQCSTAGQKCTCKMGLDSELFDITLICNLMPLVLKDSTNPKQKELLSYVQDVRKIRNQLAHLTPKKLQELSGREWKASWRDYVDKAYGKDKDIFKNYNEGKLSQVSKILKEISIEEVGNSYEEAIQPKDSADNSTGATKYVVMEPCENNLVKFITANPNPSRRQKVMCQLLDFMENNDIVLCNLNPSTIDVRNDKVNMQNTSKNMKQNYNNEQWVHCDSLAVSKQDNIFTLLMILFYIQFGDHPYRYNGKTSQNSEENNFNAPISDGDRYSNEFKRLFRKWKAINISDIRSSYIIHQNDDVTMDGRNIAL